MKRVVFLFVMISAMLLSSQTVKADKLKYYYYYTIDTSSADHFRVKLLVADLVGRDTWIKDGYIRAYAKKPYTNDTEENGEYIDIAKVYTYDQDGNGNPTHRIKAQVLMEGATVILNNAGYTKLDHTEKEYSIYKQKDYDYPQAELDVYWGPKMAGKKWYIVYFMKQDTKSDFQNKLLDWVDCTGDLGRNKLDAANYKIQRTDAKNFTFTTPALPKNNCSSESVKQDQKHRAWYIVKSTYTLYDNTTVAARDSFECLQTAKGTPFKIPSSVGNFKRVDMNIEAHDAYRSDIDKYKDDTKQGFYYDNISTFDRPNISPTVPVPGSVSGDFDQFAKKVTVYWTGVQQTDEDNPYITTSKPYIYRIKTDKQGEPLSGETWSLRGHLNKHVTKGTMNFTARLSVTYNWNRYFVNVNGQFNNFNYRHNAMHGHLNDWYVNASVGVRL